jgi:IS5 family transposase
MHPRSLFSLAEHLERLSKDGDLLEVLAGTVEFERFRPLLVKGLGYSDGARGGRPAFDPVVMFKVLVVQAQHNLSDARMEFMICDRLSWMRFFGFDLGGAMPDETTICHYRNRLMTSGTLEALMQAFEQQLREAGYLAMGGEFSMRRLYPRPGSATPRRRRPRSRRASQPGRSGATSRTRRTKRMSMRAGR